MHRISRRSAIRNIALLVAGAVFAPSAAHAAEKVPLAIKGYDPVAYFTMGKAVRGQPDLTYQWDERRYLFSSREHRELFKANPVRYAPQFPNYCAMSLVHGEVVDANPEYWLIADSKLYMFGKPVGPALFKQELGRNAAKANENVALIQKK